MILFKGAKGYTFYASLTRKYFLYRRLFAMSCSLCILCVLLHELLIELLVYLFVCVHMHLMLLCSLCFYFNAFSYFWVIEVLLSKYLYIIWRCNIEIRALFFKVKRCWNIINLKNWTKIKIEIICIATFNFSIIC